MLIILRLTLDHIREEIHGVMRGHLEEIMATDLDETMATETIAAILMRSYLLYEKSFALPKERNPLKTGFADSLEKNYDMS